ncbi:MAG: pyridoxamine 5'-phosphate oxidase family protein [Streptosporangiaceae bacterium]
MDTVSLTEVERKLLHRAVGILATVDIDGYPHAVPITVNVEGSTLVCNTGTSSHKVSNMRRNPYVSVSVIGDPKWCILIQGDASLEPAQTDRSWVRIQPIRKIAWGIPGESADS